MNNELKLHSGRVIALQELQQSSTYEDLLNGLPTKEGNQRRITYMLQEHRHQLYGVAPYLIEASEQEIELPEGESYRFGTPAALPSISCVGRFESIFPTQPNSGDASGLVVMWFQDQFQYPPPQDILIQLESIDWESLAGNFEY